MKKIYLILVLIFTISHKAESQDLHKKLQNQMWYVKGDLYKGDTCLIYPEKIDNCSGYLIFTPDQIEMHLKNTDTKFACAYEYMKNMIMVSYKVRYTGQNPKTEDVKLYYSIKELELNKGLELIPITAREYE